MEDCGMRLLIGIDTRSTVALTSKRRVSSWDKLSEEIGEQFVG